MRGYGDSEKPEGVSSYNLQLLVDDVRDLVRQLGKYLLLIVFITSNFIILFPRRKWVRHYFQMKLRCFPITFNKDL